MTAAPHRGLLVTLDGPGGAGKTTTAAALAQLLAHQGHQVHATAQPSRDQLGHLARTAGYCGYALACLVAGDRYHQQDREIRPAVASGRIVVCDRYVPSSYVLQRMDGAPIEFIEALNADADRPDLAVILTADPTVTATRINTRGTRHRFETGTTSSAQEVDLYADTARRLATRGWPLLALDTTSVAPEQIAEQISTRIAELVEGPPTRWR